MPAGPEASDISRGTDQVLGELRAATRHEHDRIDAILRLTDPMDIERYVAVMRGFDAFLAAWEARIATSLPPRLGPWFEARRRGGLARADVEWLRVTTGLGRPSTSAPPDAGAVTALPLGELAQVLGSLYVIEGSALGGRVIAPRLKSTLGLDAGRGASYFHGFGEATGAMWRDFRAVVSQEIGASPAASAQACEAARRTFAALIEIFGPLASEWC
jgi:heme oxygenase